MEIGTLLQVIESDMKAMFYDFICGNAMSFRVFSIPGSEDYGVKIEYIIDGKIVGSLCMTRNHYVDVPGKGDVFVAGMITLIYPCVKQEHRLKGYGRALIEKAKEYAKLERFTYISVLSEEDTVGFYEKLGFKFYKPVHNPWKFEDMFMRLDLN